MFLMLRILSCITFLVTWTWMATETCETLYCINWYKSCDFTSAACSYRLLWFVNIEPVLCSWNNHHLVMMDTCTCYKFSYIPQILMYFHSVQCIFKLSLEIIQYSKVCCLVPKYLEIFLSFCWFLVWFL